MTKRFEACTLHAAPCRQSMSSAAYSVYGFCLAHGLSRRKLYYMLEAGEGPRIMKCGTRTLISVEAAQRWRRARERMAAVSRRRFRRSPHSQASRATSRRQSRVRTHAPTLSAHGVTRLRDSRVSSLHDGRRSGCRVHQTADRRARRPASELDEAWAGSAGFVKRNGRAAPSAAGSF